MEAAATTTASVHSGWPYGTLSVRRTAEPRGEVVALVPIPVGVANRPQLQVVEAASAPDFWKLAPGSKGALSATLEALGGEPPADFDDATEGFIEREYNGSPTLQPRPRSLADSVGAAAACLRQVKESGGSLLVLTGAGMSVSSGVPVFRGSDGSMSADFLRFLGDYNAARKRAGMSEADDWFSFSVPQMFQKITEKEAWAYWRWRTLRALVEPAEDYRTLNALVEYFGVEKTFVVSSNCDMLHERSGIPADRVHEIHGSLGRLQCSAPCCDTLYPADEEFLERLEAEPEWVPRCPACADACLRPNVMIFGDGALVDTALQEQRGNLKRFQAGVGAGAESEKNWAVLEVGAGVVVSSIRSKAEMLAAEGAGLIRVNPSEQECVDMELSGVGVEKKYHPLVARSNEALAALGAELNL